MASGLDNGLALRIFREDDLTAICQLVSETIDCSYEGVYPGNAIAFFKDYHSPENILSDARSGLTLVAHLDGELVATGTLLGTNVRRVFVRPDRQGRGIGGILMHRLEEEATSLEILALDLSSSLPAKEFYLALRYEIVSEENTDEGGGETLRYFEMAKRLTLTSSSP